jgi:hypothetical protein
MAWAKCEAVLLVTLLGVRARAQSAQESRMQAAATAAQARVLSPSIGGNYHAMLQIVHCVECCPAPHGYQRCR